MSLKSPLRHLIAEHGFGAVHQTLNEIMAEDYAFLKSHFENSTGPALVQEVVTPQVAVQANVIVPPAIVTATPAVVTDISGVKVIKFKSKKNNHSEAPAVAEPVAVAVATVAVAPVAVATVAQVADVKSVHVEQKEYRDPKDIKKWQKSMEEKKRAELLAAGVNVEQILTKENLKQWIEVDGQTFAWVAREKAGVPDNQVAATAKALGIQSNKSKQRIHIMASKKV